MHLESLLRLFIISSISIVSSLECENFATLYGSGEKLCNTIWGGAFNYSTDLSTAYTMWYFDYGNPNDDVSATRNISANGICLESGYNHKINVSAEGSGFSECHPWKDASCCKASVVGNVEQIQSLYGDEWRWDRCGTLSQACERFFVAEACFYECDPNIALWNKYPGGGDDSWEIEGMPIRADYCDAFFTACADDMFCADGGGNFYSCAKTTTTEAADVLTVESKANAGLIVGVVVAAIFLVSLCVVLFYMRHREQRGKPIFEAMLSADEQGGNVNRMVSTSAVNAGDGNTTVGGDNDDNLL